MQYFDSNCPQRFADRSAMAAMQPVVVAALCTLAGLLAWYGWQVTARPARTPILLVGTIYGPEWDQNVWISEDLAKLHSLHSASMSPRSFDSLLSVQSGSTDRVDEEIRAALAECPADQTCLVFLDLHGATDDQNRPCLILPNSDPLDQNTWYPLQDLIQRIDRCQPARARNVVLILESGKLDVWPSAGILKNEFHQRLSELVTRFNREQGAWRIAAITASDDGQRSVALHGTDLNAGNLFSRFVAEALRGDADGYGRRGVKDQWISVAELHEFVHHRTRRESQLVGLLQTPMYFGPEDQLASRVAICASNEAHRVTTSCPVPTERQLSQVEQNRMALADLRAAKFHIAQPQAWQNLLHHSVAIVEATYGGRAAHRQLAGLQADFDKDLQYWNKWHDARTHNNLPAIVLRSIETAKAAWTALSNSGTYEDATRLFTAEGDSSKGASVTSSPGSFAGDALANASPLLWNLVRQPNLAIWSDRELFERLARAEIRFLDLLSGADYYSARVVHPEYCRLQAARNLVWDYVVGDEAQTRAITDYEAAIEQAEERLQITQLATISVRRYATAAPAMMRWTALTDQRSQGRLDAENHLQSNSNGHRAFEEGLLHWSTAGSLLSELAQEEGSETRQSQFASLQAITSDLGEVLSRWEKKWAEALKVCENHANRDIAERLRTIHAFQHCGTVWMDGCSHGRLAMRERNLIAKRSSELQGELRRNWAFSNGDLSTELQSFASMSRIDGGTNRTEGQSPHVTPEGGATLVHANDRFPGPDWSGVGRSAWDAMHRLQMETAFRFERNRVALWNGVERQLAARFLVGSAADALEAFWAIPERDGKPWYQHRADALLEEASSGALSQDQHALSQTISSVRKRVTQLTTLADGKSFAKLVAIPTLGNEKSAVVELEKNAESILPVGAGALVASARDGGSEFAWSRVGFASLGGEGSTTVSATIQYVGEDVAMLFRGHVFQLAQRPSDSLNGQVLITNAAAPDDTTVSLVAGAPQARDLMYIVDCSASMSEPLDRIRPIKSSMTSNAQAEGYRPATELQTSKLGGARALLLRMLSEFTSPELRVGLTLVGHRVAIDKDGIRALLQKDYYQSYPFPPTLQPYEDVEVVLPPGRFGDVERSLVEQRVAHLRPWGQSPIYLAIEKSLAAMERVKNNRPKDIIVITDGGNYQFNPSPAAIVSLDYLIHGAQEKGVRVHVVALESEADFDAHAYTDIQRLARETGGEFIGNYSAAMNLHRQLNQASLIPQEFSISINGGAESREEFGAEAHLGTSFEAKSHSRLIIGEYGKEFYISPGANLELEWDQRGGTVSAIPFRKHAIASETMTAGRGRAVPAELTLHRIDNASQSPLPESQRLVRFSLQRTDREVAYRPRWFWVEIRPLNANGETIGSTVYRTNDIAWLPGYSCPVGQVGCAWWPTTATHFEFKAWGTDVVLDAERTVDLTDRRNETRVIQLADGRRIDLQLKWSKDTLSIGCQQRDSSRGEGGPILLKLEGVPYKTAKHWYADDHSESLHAFQLSQASESTHRNTQAIRLRMLPLSDFRASAATLKQPIVIDAAESRESELSLSAN